MQSAIRSLLTSATALQTSMELRKMLSAYHGKAVVVTGGFGFIGSNLAIQLVEAGAGVTVIDSMVPGCGSNRFNLAPVQSDVRAILADVGSTDQFARVLRGVDIVFNLAGEISHSRSMEDPERDLSLNVLSQLRFLLACREHCPGARVVYASTRQVYGQHERLPVDEGHPIQPIDFNGVHKSAAAHYHLLLNRRRELDCIVLRLSNVYGPRMALHLPHQGFLGVYFRRVLDGKPILVYGEGEQLRDPVHVDDVVDAFLHCGALREPRHRVFNIGGSQALSLEQIARMTASFSRGSPVLQVPYPEGLRSMEIGSYISDTHRAQRELGWMPGVPFECGVRDALTYFREHSEHYLWPTTPASEPEMEALQRAKHMRAASAP